jgi:integrase
LKRAVRWRWIGSNPILQAEPPAAPKPKPRPPTPQEAGRILTEAWTEPEWGTIVWLAIVTGVRRGELCALRWRDVDLMGRVISLSRSIGQRNRETWEKDTKDHQHRRIALDPETVRVLTEHRQRFVERCAELGITLSDDAFLFSLAPDGSTYLRPNSVSERYSDLAERLGIRTSLHKLRHYSATELIAAGVDIRTVAGRLGHGGGGTTTLRVYAAWVSKSDQRAAGSLFARMPGRPEEPHPRPSRVDRAPYPYEVIAETLRGVIASGALPVGAFLPTLKAIAAKHAVAVGTAHRAVSLLVQLGYAEVVSGRSVRVLTDRPATVVEEVPAPVVTEQPAPVVNDGDKPAPMLDFVVRRRGEEVTRFSACADPNSADELREVLIDALLRRGEDETRVAAYELEVRQAGGRDLIRTFVASRHRRRDLRSGSVPAI